MSYVIISWKVDHFSRVPFFNCTFVIANDIENLGGIFNLGYSTAYFEGIWNTTVCSCWISTKKSQTKDYHSIHGGLKSEQFEIPQILAHRFSRTNTPLKLAVQGRSFLFLNDLPSEKTFKSAHRFDIIKPL